MPTIHNYIIPSQKNDLENDESQYALYFHYGGHSPTLKNTSQ